MEKGSSIGFTLIMDFVRESGGNLSILNNAAGGATVQFSLPYFES
jgi:K+-sensing histidine kinase KdpD